MIVAYVLLARKIAELKVPDLDSGVRLQPNESGG
jgi:hypothetical protein